MEFRLNETQSYYDTVVILSEGFYQQMSAFQVNFDTQAVAFSGADFGEDFAPPTPKPEPEEPSGGLPSWLIITIIVLGLALIGGGVFIVVKRK